LSIFWDVLLSFTPCVDDALCGRRPIATLCSKTKEQRMPAFARLQSARIGAARRRSRCPTAKEAFPPPPFFCIMVRTDKEVQFSRKSAGVDSLGRRYCPDPKETVPVLLRCPKDNDSAGCKVRQSCVPRPLGQFPSCSRPRSIPLTCANGKSTDKWSNERPKCPQGLRRSKKTLSERKSTQKPNRNPKRGQELYPAVFP